MICLIVHKRYGNSDVSWFPNVQDALIHILETKQLSPEYEVYHVQANEVTKLYPIEKE